MLSAFLPVQIGIFLSSSSCVMCNALVCMFALNFLIIALTLILWKFLMQLLACLRMLIRSCVYGNTPKEEIQKLFPPDVSPELQKLLTLLLQKFQSEWKDDVLKDQVLYAEHGSNRKMFID